MWRNSEWRNTCCLLESVAHLLLAREGTDSLTDAVSWMSTPCQAMPLTQKGWAPSNTGAENHSVSMTWCDVLASALFQAPLPGSGGRSPLEPFEDCLRLTLLLNTLLSPQRILGCKWFPAAFAENGSLPCELLVELLYLVSGGWVHQYLKATKAKSSQICQFASFEGRYENFLTFPFVSWAFFFSFFLYFLF